MANAPVVLFVYNRPRHTRETISALQKNVLAQESELFIYSDGPENGETKFAIEEVRHYIKTVNGFKKVTIINRQENFGLANSIIHGVTEIANRYGKVIVLEDDLVTSPYFLSYMNGALKFYEEDHRIFSITGMSFPFRIPSSYIYDIYLSYRACSWGWGTWNDRWEKSDWKVSDFSSFSKSLEAQKAFNRGGDDLTPLLKKQIEENIDSWAIRWCYTHFKHNAFCLYPTNSKVLNIGFDGSGRHCGQTKKYDVTLDYDERITFIKDITIDENIIKNFQSFFKEKSSTMRLKLFIRKLFDHKIYYIFKNKGINVK